jgi:hypothetical protein
MKSLIVVLLSISLCVNSQIARDKSLHLCAGTVIGTWGYFTTLNENLQPLHAIIAATIAGAGKELVIDKWLKFGTPDWRDFTYTVAGGIIAAGTVSAIKGVVKNRKHKKGSYQMTINGINLR